MMYMYEMSAVWCGRDGPNTIGISLRNFLEQRPHLFRIEAGTPSCGNAIHLTGAAHTWLLRRALTKPAPTPPSAALRADAAFVRARQTSQGLVS